MPADLQGADAPLRRQLREGDGPRPRAPARAVSEQDRVGIGTFQPKDEKNQDSTELTGDINYRKIATFGSDSDPRAFNFDGEFNIANRGILEFVEILKLDVAFLYDLLGATQERKIKPKKFAQTDIDEVIIGHTNEAEYKKLLNNEFMEALRDRTVKVDIPYITKVSEEVKIYTKDFTSTKVGKHVAPHTLYVAALWAVLTRLEDPKKHSLSLLQKAKLYDGKTLPGLHPGQHQGAAQGEPAARASTASRRATSRTRSRTRWSATRPTARSTRSWCSTSSRAACARHSLINSDEQRKRYGEMLSVVKQEYEDIVKNEVQRAISADEDMIAKLCANYIDNIKAYTQKEKVKNPYTGQDEEPDERLMRSIEEKIDIPE